MDKASLRLLLEQIRDERRIAANTADRIGRALLELLEYVVAYYVSKTEDETIQGFITFTKGFQIGDQFVSGLLGEGGVFRVDADGRVYLEADKLYIRLKAYFDTVEIRRFIHSAGNRIASVAGAKCTRVEWLDAGGDVLEQTQANMSYTVKFRCYFRASDGEDTVTNDFVVGDQAYVRVTNASEGSLVQHTLWRLVVGRNASGVLTDDGEAWIDLSNLTTETLVIDGRSYTHAGFLDGSDVPLAQDDIVQLGHISDITRQGAIIEYVTGGDSPTYQIYQGISDFSLSGKNQVSFGYNTMTGHAYMNVFGDFRLGSRNDDGPYISYNQQTRALDIKARVQMMAGSTFADGLGTKSGNLLRNTSFTGEYLSEKVDYNTAVDAGTVIFSDPLKFWSASAVEVVCYADSVTAYAAKFSASGRLSQDVSLKAGEKYSLSFRAIGSGTLSWQIGGESGTLSLEGTLERYDITFECSIPSTSLILSSTGISHVMEIMLSQGSTSVGWQPHYLDSDRAQADYYTLEYLKQAIANASTQILGGLVLTQIIKVGSFLDREMVMETGGMSGVYLDGSSPYLWCGGTMEDAIYTIARYAANPGYQPSQEELSEMATFVVTHGGRAILNDLILRGYIHALGGTILGDIDIVGGALNVKDGNNTVVKVNGGTVSRTGNDEITIVDAEGLYVRRGNEGFRLTTAGFERFVPSHNGVTGGWVNMYAKRYVRSVEIASGGYTILSKYDDFVVIKIVNGYTFNRGTCYIGLPEGVSAGKVLTIKMTGGTGYLRNEAKTHDDNHIPASERSKMSTAPIFTKAEYPEVALVAYNRIELVFDGNYWLLNSFGINQ